MFKKSKFSQRQGRRNFGREEQVKKEHIICFECKKSGYIKIDYPKLRKEKRSSKEKFKKFKKTSAAWRESDYDSTVDEASDNEVVKLCLVEKEDDTNEVHFESNSFNDLQDDYNDLYEESLKMVSQNSMLRKQIIALTSEIDKSNKHVNKLTAKNNELNDKVLDLTKCLEKFTKGQKDLDLLLGS